MDKNLSPVKLHNASFVTWLIIKLESVWLQTDLSIMLVWEGNILGHGPGISPFAFVGQ